jgi:2-haloacid dehalogenase
MIKFIFLDLDDTILDFHRSEAVALRKTLQSLNVNPTDEVIARYSEINLAHWKALERKELTREQVLTGRFRQLFEELDMNVSPSVAQSLYEKNLSESHFFIDGAPRLLMTLSQKYPLYIVSNGTTLVQTSRIASSGIGRYFKGIFLSQQLGADKPQIEFFERATGQIEGYKPEESIILGDSLTSDIQGGINAGMHTCWFNPHHRERGDITPEFEITDLAEFDNVLKKLNEN